MEMIFGTLELILGDFVQIKKFELDGDPLYFYGFYIYGAFWTLGWKNVSFLEPENDRNQDFLHCWIFRKMIFFSKMMFYTFKTFIGRIDPDKKKGTLRVISE